MGRASGLGRSYVTSICAVLTFGIPGLGPTGAAAGECPQFKQTYKLSWKACDTGLKPALSACEIELQAKAAGGELDPTLNVQDWTVECLAKTGQCPHGCQDFSEYIYDHDDCTVPKQKTWDRDEDSTNLKQGVRFAKITGCEDPARFRSWTTVICFVLVTICCLGGFGFGLAIRAREGDETKMNDEKDFDFEDKENPLDSQVYSTDKERRDFLQDNYPKSLGAVSRKWLSALLQKELTAHSVSKILEAGVTSDAAIFDIEYAAGVSGPASICLKYAKSTESNREFAMGADMYKKELFFFNNFYQEVAAVMTIPEPIGVFIDPEKPEEFYCLAMDDLNLSNDSIDQIVGITIEDCKQLGSMAAKFHAAFWEHPLLKNDIVCKGVPDAAAVFFEGWAVAAMTTPGAWDTYVGLSQELFTCDLEPTPADKKAHKLLQKYPTELVAAFHTVLDNRPGKTLCHGDMRADNMFRKHDGSGFTVLDWQTYGAAPPGVEMHQLLANQIRDQTQYARLPEVLKLYLEELHALCPDARAYTYDMLWEDFRICAALGNMCLAVAFGPMLADPLVGGNPEHPNTQLFAEFIPRCRATYTVLDIAGVVLSTAADLGLEL